MNTESIINLMKLYLLVEGSRAFFLGHGGSGRTFLLIHSVIHLKFEMYN